MKFMELFMNGEVSASDLPLYIAKWHDSDSNDEVYGFLGLTLKEYLFVAVDEEKLYEVRQQRLGK